jgi:hypothetical protein
MLDRLLKRNDAELGDLCSHGIGAIKPETLLFDNQTKKGRLSGEFLAPKVTYRLRHLFGAIGNVLRIQSPVLQPTGALRLTSALVPNLLYRKGSGRHPMDQSELG